MLHASRLLNMRKRYVGSRENIRAACSPHSLHRPLSWAGCPKASLHSLHAWHRVVIVFLGTSWGAAPTSSPQTGSLTGTRGLGPLPPTPPRGSNGDWECVVVQFHITLVPVQRSLRSGYEETPTPEAWVSRFLPGVLPVCWGERTGGGVDPSIHLF